MFRDTATAEMKSRWEPCQCSGCKRARANADRQGATMADFATLEQLQERMDALEARTKQLEIMYMDLSQCLTELEQFVDNTPSLKEKGEWVIAHAEPLKIPETYGWICPRCELVHAPSVLSCYCGDAQAADPSFVFA